MNFNTILYTAQDGITTITLNRPESYNAFTDEMRTETLEAFTLAAADEDCRVVVLAAAGKAFCSGQDLKEIAEGKTDFSGILKNGYNPLILAMRSMEKPIVCRLNGIAAGGGCSLVLACDYIIADERASLVEVFVGIGLVLDCGSSFFLPRLIGTNRAFELATMGGKVKAAQAVEWGMINKAVPTEDLDAEVQSVVSYYAQAPTKAIGMMKRMLNQSTTSSLEEVLTYEAHYQQIAGDSADYAEGLQSFIDKRKPIFTGK
ncbi:MAG: 2-(1,2-epoxy-1,2-dihydrophenyl)acetyl-CoA isomerase [Bacteroidetes bacterium]|nr:MAG: 2-(1,2-epoxy-1,2-dihydrophenyl)acetyl-CoA isomerase [Bacteroidota bacterium]